MTSREVLAGIKAYLLTNGWTQDQYGVDGGQRCFLGALRSVTGEEHDGHPVVDLVETYLGGDSVAMWNDEADRTLADVVSLLDRVLVAATPRPEVQPLHVEQPELLEPVLA